MQEQAANSNAESSRPSSSERSSSSLFPLEPKKGMESDEEISIVPEMGSDATGPSTCGRDGSLVGGSDRFQGSADVQGKRRRSQADKETKRLKRLLRNRVSAQQARERKKAYLKDLEVKNKHLEEMNSELEERLSTLKNENQMLRQILKNTTVSKRGSNSSTEDVFL